MNRFLFPKPRRGAAQYWPPLENQVPKFKLTVLSRQKEFLSGTGTIGKLRFSSFTFYARFSWHNHFEGCKFEKGVVRLLKIHKFPIHGSEIWGFSEFQIFRLPPKFMKMQISSRDDCNVFTSTLVACAPQFSAPYDQNCNIQRHSRHEVEVRNRYYRAPRT